VKRALILDFDQSVAPLADARSLELSAWQDPIRYGCSLRALRRLDTVLTEGDHDGARVTFLGSGDFHHVSFSLIRRRKTATPFQVVIFDNHPDNMRYPWGIHCGSWVHHVCALPFVSRVTVVGITSADVGWSRLWENHLLPLYRGKLAYWCFAKVSRLVRLLPGVADLSRAADRTPEALAARILAASADPIYLSIDKDVVGVDSILTNWDQGIFDAEDLVRVAKCLKPRVFAADVTGEISFFRYSRWWKRALARIDGQSLDPPPRLHELQAAQHRLNEQLLEALTAEG
jgi:hypothetical protein